MLSVKAYMGRDSRLSTDYFVVSPKMIEIPEEVFDPTQSQPPTLPGLLSSIPKTPHAFQSPGA